MRKDGRILPDFIVVGAMKSGTTTLYRYLDGHPDVGMSADKETDFFVAEKSFGRGLDWYSAQFDGRFAVHGEASPNYTKCRDFAGVPGRIATVCPHARLIYVVRDPIARAESQYRHARLQRTITKTPETLFASDEYHHIMDASHYARQLGAYLEEFPMDRILILDFVDLVDDPQSVMDRTCAFIGVSPIRINRAGAFNDSVELSRVPAPILRFAQSSIGRRIGRSLSREARDGLRRSLALGKPREAERFPPDLKERMAEDLSSDVEEFRRMTGMSFASWTL